MLGGGVVERRNHSACTTVQYVGLVGSEGKFNDVTICRSVSVSVVSVAVIVSVVFVVGVVGY